MSKSFKAIGGLVHKIAKSREVCPIRRDSPRRFSPRFHSPPNPPKRMSE